MALFDVHIFANSLGADVYLWKQYVYHMVRTKAYTLIELIVTMTILALLAAFVVPTYQLILSQLQLNTAVNQVSDLIRLSEQKTVTEQQIYSIDLVAGGTSITQKRNPSTVISTLNLPTYVTIGAVNFGGATNVAFTTAGSPGVAGNFVLTDSARNKSRQIDIRPSGAVISGPEF
jgi:prepilin-type N-terminal cleavage/methylation domain-containing protein